METKKQKLMLTIWLVLVVVSRILFFLIAQDTAVDTYAYYENALVKGGAKAPVLTSGLAYAYTKCLADLLFFVGNNMTVVIGFQTILQIAWLVLFFFGVNLLWGSCASYVSGTVLLISPYLFNSIRVIEPVNYFMLHLAVLLFLYGVFCTQTAKKGWYRSNSGELYLMLIGFYMGVVCTWNYIGFLLIGVMIYVLIRNRKALGEKLWMQKNLELEEKEQIMPVKTQGLVLFAGMLVGMFATLMKYTGFSGWTVWEQLFWWQDQFAAWPGRCQDISAMMLIWLIIALSLGFACRFYADRHNLKTKEKEEYEEILQKEAEEKQKGESINHNVTKKSDLPLIDTGDDEMSDEFFIAKDGREIKYIENPLPGPKKHVKRDLDFDFDFDDIEEVAVEEQKDDFDYQIDDDTDFDIN